MPRSPERHYQSDNDDLPSPISPLSDAPPPPPPPAAPAPPPAQHNRRSSYIEPRRRDKDRGRERDPYRDSGRDMDHDMDRDRYRDQDRDRDMRPPPPPVDDPPRSRRPAADQPERRTGELDPRGYRSSGGGGGSGGPGGAPRVRDPRKQPPPSPVRRQSITEKLKSSWGGILPRRDRDNSLSRRASTSAAAKTNPVIKVRAWLEQCNTDHGDHCYDATADNTTFRPFWLVDCVDARLVKAHPEDQYVALSYVWEPPGGRKPLIATRAGNVPAMEERIPESDLPSTISDAMWLVRKLGLTYLWVDRLCIVQDDEREKDRHVRNMAHVFANAYLTIVAACGNANAPLVGLDKKSTSKSSPKPPGGGNKLHNDLVAESKWNTRAWTVEEALYARRAVYVFEDAVTWECHCDTFQSHQSKLKILRPTSHGKCAGRQGDASLAFQHAPWPDLDEYARIVMDYSMRRLSFVQDTSAALAGVTTVLSKVFQGGFVWGMPVMFLEAALLWQPQISIRRKVLPPEPSSPYNALPSWSWMGWYFDDIPVDLLLWRAAADYVESAPPSRRGAPTRRPPPQTHFRLRSLGINWTITDRTIETPLISDGLQYRGQRFRRASSLPRGWSRAGNNYDWKHESDPAALFRYPIPVAPTTGPERLVESPPPPGSFLSFTTTRGFFDVEVSRNQAFKGRSNPPIAVGNVFDRSGRWAGQIRSHDAWMGVQSSNHGGGEKLEFVAVSEASEKRGSVVFDEEYLRDVQDAEGTVHYVNVLWVERVGEICYRRGLGHILASVWNAHARDRIPVLLG